MSTSFRIAGIAALVLLTACGEPVVGTSPYANTPPRPEPIADLTTLEDVPAMTTLTIADDEDVNALEISFESSNPALIDPSGITLTGTDGNHTIVLVPRPDANGTATITVTIVDTLGHVDDVVITFEFIVTPVNDLPVITGLTDLTIDEDGTTGTQTITITDVDDPIASVTLTGVADDTTLVPTLNLTPGATPGTFTWSVTPPADANGSSVLTFTATDSGGSTVGTVTLTVTAVNDAPVLGTIAEITTDEDVVSAPPTAFTVNDVDDDPATLTLTASSSNEAVVPTANVVFGGSGTNRTITVLSAPDAFGSAVITVTVSDGRLSATTTFDVTITPVNDPPVLSAVVDQTTDEDTDVPTITVTVSDIDDVVGDLVLTGTSSTTTVIANGGIAIAGTTGTRTIDLTPVPNANGTTTITLTLTDPDGATDVETFDVDVASVNDQPVFVTTVSNLSTNEDTPTAALAFSVNDVETAPAMLMVTATSSDTSVVAPGGIAIANTGGGNRTIQLSPVLNAFGTTTITVTVNDGSGAPNATNTFSFVLTVISQNDLPTISLIGDQTIEEDSSTSAIAFTISDVETPAASLVLGRTSSDTTIVATSGVVLGGAGGNRTVTVTPRPDMNGTVTIRITVTDADGGSAFEEFVVDVQPQNDAPRFISAADVTTNEDTPVTNYVVTIEDPDDTLATGLDVAAFSSSNPSIIPTSGFTQTSQQPHPTNPNQYQFFFTITPVADAFGNGTTVTLRVTDGLETDDDTIVVNVLPINDAPTISNIANRTVNEDQTPSPTIAFTVGDVDDDVNDLTVTATVAMGGVLTPADISFSGTGANRTATFTLPANLNGASTITFTVSDGTDSAADSFVFTITAINDAPTILASTASETIQEDESTASRTVTLGDVETNPCALTLTGTSNVPAIVGPSNFTFGGSCANRTVVVTPALNANTVASGPITITLTVTDAGVPLPALTATSQFTLTITPVNDPPVITAVANQTTPEDVTLNGVTVTVTDPDVGDTITLEGTSGTDSVIADAGVMVSGSASPFTLTITPVAEQSGMSVITLVANDGTVDSADSTFTVTVTAVDDPPVISAISDVTIDEDGTTGAIAFTVTDIDTDEPTLVVSRTSGDTTLLPLANVPLTGSEPNFSVTATPVADLHGASLITITASDATTTVTETFTVTVTSVNDLPTIAALSDVTIDEDDDTGAIAIVIDDTEDGCVGLTPSATSSVPTLVDGAGVVFGGTCPSRTVTVTPIANANGTTTITVTVTDSDGATASADFDLIVTALADPPVAAAGTLSTQGNVTFNGSVATLVTDPDSTTFTFTLTDQSANGAIITIQPDGSYTYTPPPGWLTSDDGSDWFEYTVTADGDVASAQITITTTAPVRWHVDDSAPDPGTFADGRGGTDAHPFANFDDFDDANDRVGDEIYVFYGTGTPYTAEIELLDQQQLLGQPQLPSGNLPRIDSGAVAVTTGDGNVVQNLALESCTVGIEADGLAGSLTLTNVDVTGCATGLYVDGTNAAAASVTATDLVVTGATVAGADLADASFTAGSGTSFEATSGFGFRATGVTFSSALVDRVELIGASTDSGVYLQNCTNRLTLGSIVVDVSNAADGVHLEASSIDLGSAGTIKIAGSGEGLFSNGGGALLGDLATFDCVTTGDNCIELEGSTSPANLQLGLTIESFDASTSANATAVYVRRTSGSFVIDDAVGGTIAGTSGRRILVLDEVAGASVEVASMNATPTGNESTIQITNSPGASLLVAGGSTANSGGVILATGNAPIIELSNSATARFTRMSLTTNAAGTSVVSLTQAASATFELSALDGGTGAAGRCATVSSGSTATSLTFRGSTVSSAAELVSIAASTGTTALTIESSGATQSTLTGTGGTQCIGITTNPGVTSMAATINGATLVNCGTVAAMRVTDTSAANVSVDVVGAHFNGPTATASAIYVSTTGSGDKSLDVSGTTTFDDFSGDVIRYESTGCTGRNEFVLDGSRIGNATELSSASTGGNGVLVSIAGSACRVSHEFVNNDIYGVQAAARAALNISYALSGTSVSNVEMHGNEIDLIPGASISDAHAVSVRSTGSIGACFDIDTNTLDANPADEFNGYRTGTGASIIEGFATSLYSTITGANTLLNLRVNVGDMGNPAFGFVGGMCDESI